MDEKFIVNQVYAFVFSVVAGAVWLVVYDVLKIVRHIFVCNSVVTAVCDTTFWLTGAALIIVTALLLNEGYIRSYLFIGIFFGAILYVLTIGNVLRRIGRFVYVKSAPLRSKVKSVWDKYSAKRASKRVAKYEAKQGAKNSTKHDKKGVKKDGEKKSRKKCIGKIEK